MFRSRLILLLSLLPFLLISPSLTMAQSTDLKFHSVITAVNQTDTSEGIITVSIHGLDVDVVVNGDTEIEESGEEIDLASISAGDFVAISSFFSDLGIVADEIHVLDTRIEQFRLRGFISATDTLADTTVITLLGVDVILNTNTKIVRRNTDALITPPELAVGDLINVRGGLEDGTLVATRVHVGTREPGRIELDGEILTIAESSITIALESGGSIAVLFDEDTVINGNLIIGAFVEVEGFLTVDLSLIATEVVVDVDGDRDADDDNRRGLQREGNNDADDVNNDGTVEIGAETRLRTQSNNLDGKVETRYRTEENEINQKFEVEIEYAPAGTVYAIRVFFGDQTVDFGTFTANELGKAEREFESEDGSGELAGLLPEGLTVRDITRVQVLQDGNVVLEGDL